MSTKMQVRKRESQRGRVLVPAIMYMAGVPLSLVVILWFFFFRG